MPVLSDSILIDAPADSLFALSQDYALRREWDQFVREMRLLDGAKESAKGVRVWVCAWTGMTMEVVFTSFQPPHSVAMKMTRGPRLFRNFAGTWLFKNQPDGQTEVTFRYGFTTHWRLLRWLIDPVICWMFRRDIRGRLRGLKEGVEKKGLLERLEDSIC